MNEEILPCPFCGCTNVWGYISCFTVQLKCRECGAHTKGNCATVIYKKNNPPSQLIGVETYEPDALTIKEGDKEIAYPEHGYVGVNAMLALKAYGAIDRWNKREIKL